MSVVLRKLRLFETSVVLAVLVLSGCVSVQFAAGFGAAALSKSQPYSPPTHRLGLYELCHDLSMNKSGILPVVGYRILEIRNLKSGTAPGVSSIVDRYASFNSRNAKASSASTVIEAIQAEIAAERLAIFLEYQSQDGRWKRSSFDPSLNSIVTIDIPAPTASHGIVFEQFPTEYEKSGIFGVSITVVDISSGQVAAQNLGLIQAVRMAGRVDQWGGSLQWRCGYPEEENFVGSWLSSLVRPYPVGTSSPYDARMRVAVADENRRWAHTACFIPKQTETHVNSSYTPNIKGKISFVGAYGVDIYSTDVDLIYEVKLPQGSSIFDERGKRLELSSLKEGDGIWVWFENCKRSPGSEPKAAVSVVFQKTRN